MKINEVPYLYIMNFLNEVPEPQPFAFCLILANQFNGKVLWNSDEFITKVGERYYGVEGEIYEEELDILEWSEVDKLSIFHTIESYESMKWLFIQEDRTNDEFMIQYGLN